MRKNNKNKGFTLVELLIVVAIIGILAAVLTPQFLNARKVAADKAAEAFAHNIYTAVQAVIATGGEDAKGLDFNCSDATIEIGEEDNTYTIQVPSTGLNVESCKYEGDVVTVKYKGGIKEEAIVPAGQ